MSYALLALALAETGFLVWATRRWVLEPGNVALLLMLFIILPVCLDSTVVATGRWLEFGPALETANRIRFTWFIFSMLLMWPICTAIFGNAGFAWAQSRALVPVLLVIAVAVGGYEATQAWQQEFHPACVFDIKRYVMQVPDGQACMGSAVGDGTFGLPLVVPLGTLAVVLTGIALWWKRGWPWLGLTCLLVVGVVSLPQNAYTTFLSYPFDGLLMATLAVTAMRFYQPVNGG